MLYTYIYIIGEHEVKVKVYDIRFKYRERG
jgi:hypothetical protein